MQVKMINDDSVLKSPPEGASCRGLLSPFDVLLMFQSTVVGIKQIEAKSKTAELPAEVHLLVWPVPDWLWWAAVAF